MFPWTALFPGEPCFGDVPVPSSVVVLGDLIIQKAHYTTVAKKCTQSVAKF